MTKWNSDFFKIYLNFFLTYRIVYLPLFLLWFCLRVCVCVWQRGWLSQAWFYIFFGMHQTWMHVLPYLPPSPWGCSNFQIFHILVIYYKRCSGKNSDAGRAYLFVPLYQHKHSLFPSSLPKNQIFMKIWIHCLYTHYQFWCMVKKKKKKVISVLYSGGHGAVLCWCYKRTGTWWWEHLGGGVCGKYRDSWCREWWGGGSRNQYAKRHINGEVSGGFVTGTPMFEFVFLVKRNAQAGVCSKKNSLI